MAQRTEIAAEIEALSVHCRPPIMEVEQRASWTRDWCNDLAEFPIEAIRIACRKWRLSGATKFPTPGQLLPSIRESLPSEKQEVLREWAPATEDDYRAMSLRDKIREHQILAQQAYRKAGPMFRNTSAGAGLSKASGIHLTVDEMPETYRHWVAQAEQHTAEATRLRAYLRQEGRAEEAR